MSKGEREITSKLNHFYRGREYSGGETPDAWCSRGEKSHVFKRGKHVYVVAPICFGSDSVSLLSSIIQYKIQGEKDC